jgi:tetratricopeptide (TPR) repeat protein
MAEAILASADLPEELRALVGRKAEGNPFFVEEVIKALGETGAIRRDGERWVLGRPLDQIEVPDTIQDVLMSRIDRLEEEPRQALQLAAVIGREFTQRLLDRIAEIRRGTTAVLRELQAIELIYEKALFPELAYMFKHALTQDVAYGSLLTRRRRQLHRRIGEAIEELYADRLAEHYAVLAHHFARAEDWTRAATYFEQAADQAAAAFAVHEALALCVQAIEALDRSADGDAVARKRGDLHTKKANLLMLVSDFEGAHAEHDQAGIIARQLADRVREGLAAAGMAVASIYGHKFERGHHESGRATEIGRAVGSAEIVAAGQWTTGFLQLLTGHLAEARNSLAQAHTLSSSEGVVFYHAMSSVFISNLDNWQGKYGSALAKANECIEMARGHNLLFALLDGLFSLGLPLTGKGDYDQALAAFTEGLALAEKTGDETYRNRLLNTLGWLYAECGNFDDAIELNDRGLTESRARGDPETIANCELNLGDAYRVKGDLALSREYFESTYRLACKPSTSDWLKWRYSQHLFAGLGEAWLASDEPAKAADFCNRCLELATRTDSKKYLVRGWRLKGEIAAARLQWEEAEEALRKALTFAKPVGNPTQLWKTHLALGQLYHDTQRTDAARSSFAAARKVIYGIRRSLQTPELKQGFERSPQIRAVVEQCQID